MKTLPEHPSLDHVRQQAKDLLSQLRSTDPAATLAGAQAELAQEYGFRSWAELKAEVDRLRATARVANAGTADQLAEAFGLGQVTGPMTAIERSWAGEVWSLPSDRGLWAATQLFEWTPVIDHHLDDEVRLVEAARSAGLAAPRPVRSTDGRFLVTIGDHRWRVHEEVKLGPAPVRVTTDVAAVAGHALGVLHRLSLPTDRSITAPPSAPVQDRWLSSRPTEASWQYLARQAAEAGRPWAGVLQTAIPALLDISAVCADLSSEPVVLSKYRLLPTDLRPGPGGGWVILNWEHAGPIPPRQELGASLAECDKGDDPAVRRAFLAGYRSSGIHVPTLDTSMFTTAISATLNWTATRINVALTSDNEERRQLADREVPLLLANPPSRQRFHRILEAVS
jgi:hypothetical protein